jgi:hypothetical protein
MFSMCARPCGVFRFEKKLFWHGQLRQTWSAMLQMVPLMSKDRAQALLRLREDCSCPRKMYDLFNGRTATSTSTSSSGGNDTSGVATGASSTADIANSLGKRALLLQSSFGGEKSGGPPRNYAKLSKHLHNLVTATDPSAVIHDI